MNPKTLESKIESTMVFKLLKLNNRLEFKVKKLRKALKPFVKLHTEMLRVAKYNGLTELNTMGMVEPSIESLENAKKVWEETA